MARYPDLAQVQARSQAGIRTMTQMVVIHATDNDASAEAEGAYVTRRTDNVSAHFYVDADSAVQAVDTLRIAYTSHPTSNSRSVQVELCGFSNQLPDAVLRQAAPLVARVCQEFGLPIRKITPEQLRAGTTGICGHDDVTIAWRESTHTDPGPDFPWSRFIGYVQMAEDAMGLTPQEYNLIVQGAITADNALFYWLRRIAEGRNPLTGDPAGVGLPQIAARLEEILTAVTQVRTDLGDQIAHLQARVEALEHKRL